MTNNELKRYYAFEYCEEHGIFRATCSCPELTTDEIILTIMTQHWDMIACSCWICLAGRANGLHPREDFLSYRNPRGHAPRVKVDVGKYPQTLNQKENE